MSELQVTANPTFPSVADLTVETSVRFYSEVTTGNANVSNICVKYAARMFFASFSTECSLLSVGSGK